MQNERNRKPRQSTSFSNEHLTKFQQIPVDQGFILIKNQTATLPHT